MNVAVSSPILWRGEREHLDPLALWRKCKSGVHPLIAACGLGFEAWAGCGAGAVLGLSAGAPLNVQPLSMTVLPSLCNCPIRLMWSSSSFSTILSASHASAYSCSQTRLSLLIRKTNR